MILNDDILYLAYLAIPIDTTEGILNSEPGVCRLLSLLDS